MTDFNLRTTKIPTAYEELSFIQSSGSQWLHTGHTAQANKEYTYVLDFDGSALVNNTTLFGGRTDGGNRSPLFYFNDLQGEADHNFHFNYAGYNSVASPTHQIACTKNGRHLVKMYINELTHKAGVTVDGTAVYSNVSWTGTVYSGFETCLFCDYSSGTAIELSSYKLYNFKVYDGTTLIKNMIPCRKRCTGEIGAYDTVTETFYGNAG